MEINTREIFNNVRWRRWLWDMGLKETYEIILLKYGKRIL